MQKQVELTTLFQQAFLPGKDKTNEHSPLSLSSKTDIAHSHLLSMKQFPT